MLRRITAITINMGVVIIMEIMGNTIRAILIDFQDLSLCQPPSIPQRSIRIPHQAPTSLRTPYEFRVEL